MFIAICANAASGETSWALRSETLDQYRAAETKDERNSLGSRLLEIRVRYVDQVERILQSTEELPHSVTSDDPVLKLTELMLELKRAKIDELEFIKGLAADTRLLDAPAILDGVVLPDKSRLRAQWFEIFDETAWETPWEIVRKTVVRNVNVDSLDAIVCLIELVRYADGEYGETLWSDCANLLRERPNLVLKHADRLEEIGYFFQSSFCADIPEDERAVVKEKYSNAADSQARTKVLRWLDCVQ